MKQQDTKQETKDIGFGIQVPPQPANTKVGDPKDPFYGTLKVKGASHIATVVAAKMKNTATVTWEWKHYNPKFERYERKRTKIHAHNPDSINAKEGDKVRIMQCRPLSKTKHYVIIEVLK